MRPTTASTSFKGKLVHKNGQSIYCYDIHATMGGNESSLVSFIASQVKDKFLSCLGRSSRIEQTSRPLATAPDIKTSAISDALRSVVVRRGIKAKQYDTTSFRPSEGPELTGLVATLQPSNRTNAAAVDNANEMTANGVTTQGVLSESPTHHPFFTKSGIKCEHGEYNLADKIDKIQSDLISEGSIPIASRLQFWATMQKKGFHEPSTQVKSENEEYDHTESAFYPHLAVLLVKCRGETEFQGPFTLFNDERFSLIVPSEDNDETPETDLKDRTEKPTASNGDGGDQ